MSIVQQIKRTFDISFKKEWYDTYWAFDIHGTILKPSYDLNETSFEFYPYAKEALRLISKREDIHMIMYTCSYPHEIQKYLTHFTLNSISFDHVNKNPGISSNMGNFGFYDEKFYFNVLFEDKAGFDPETEWEEVFDLMEMYNKELILPNRKWSTKY